MKAQTYKVELVNVMSVGTMCGYGTGKTREEAVADALRKAREEKGDPNAYYAGGVVCFAEKLYC